MNVHGSDGKVIENAENDFRKREEEQVYEKKRNIAVLLAAVLTFGSAGSVFAEEPADTAAAEAEEQTETEAGAGDTEGAKGQIVIYHTNDSHGYLSGSDSVVGIDQVAGLKNADPESILVDAETPPRACRWPH